MFFEAYRMDVEISDSLDDVKLAKGCQPSPADFADGVVPNGRKTCNFWGFLRHVGDPAFDPRSSFNDPNMADSTTQVRGFDLVADPDSPTVNEVRNIYKWYVY